MKSERPKSKRGAARNATKKEEILREAISQVLKRILQKIAGEEMIRSLETKSLFTKRSLKNWQRSQWMIKFA